MSQAAHLSLSDVAFDAGSDPAFTITSVPALPFDLAPYPASVDVRVTFTPTAAGPASATLLITVADPARPTPALVSVSLTGNGAEEIASERMRDLLDSSTGESATARSSVPGPEAPRAVG